MLFCEKIVTLLYAGLKYICTRSGHSLASGHSHTFPFVKFRSPLFGTLWRSVTNPLGWNLNWSAAIGIAINLRRELCARVEILQRTFIRVGAKVCSELCTACCQLKSIKICRYAQNRSICDVYTLVFPTFVEYCFLRGHVDLSDICFGDCVSDCAPVANPRIDTAINKPLMR